MITEKNESKTLTKDISRECKCKLDGTKCNSNQWWNNTKCRWDCKKTHVCEKDYVWHPTLCNSENPKYEASIMDKIICDEVIDIKETNFNEKTITCKTQSFYVLLAFFINYYSIIYSC